MAWIKTISVDQAEGPLAQAYQETISRAGRVYEIVKLQGLNPPVLQSSMAHYINIMHRASPLSRIQREMLATVVSRANGCHY